MTAFSLNRPYRRAEDVIAKPIPLTNPAYVHLPEPSRYAEPIANYPPSVGAVMAAIEGTCPIMRRFAASQYYINYSRQDTSWGGTFPDFPASLAPDGAVIYVPYNVASTANVTLESVAAAEAPTA